jgi:hypothetical protein
MRKRHLRPALPLRDLDHHGKANHSHLTDDWRPGSFQAENRL